LDLSTTIHTNITVTNNGASPSSGTANTEVQMSVDDGSNNLAPPPQLDVFVPTGGYAYTLNPGDSVSSGTLTKNSSSSDLYSAGAVLAEFTGLGSITLGASTFTQTVLANTGGNTFATQMTNASLGGSVTYFYTPVPEPGTMVLLGLGMASVFAVGSRRRRSA
jgi:hypothetical protein